MCTCKYLLINILYPITCVIIIIIIITIVIALTARCLCECRRLVEVHSAARGSSQRKVWDLQASAQGKKKCDHSSLCKYRLFRLMANNQLLLCCILFNILSSNDLMALVLKGQSFWQKTGSKEYILLHFCEISQFNHLMCSIFFIYDVLQIPANYIFLLRAPKPKNSP